MLSKPMETALNDQVRAEFSASYTYLAMAAYCESLNYAGIASWLEHQAEEEQEHAMKLYRFIHDRGGRVTLQALPEPKAEYGTMAEVFDHVLAHEQKVTAMIHNLYELAIKEKDYACFPLLHWFIEEQIEEERNSTDVLNLVRGAGASTHTMLYVDKQLGKRQSS